MLIHSLILENVKSYTLTSVEFTSGTNAIVGDNGSGKTTILEAIGFALFDHLPYTQADFVREGQKSARVTLDFLSSSDERTYQVVRQCGSSNAYTVFDPELSLKICEGKADVSQFLRQHLGIDADTDLADLFSNAVGVPQGSCTAAFLDIPSRRKSIFDPLLRVAEYGRAYERLRDPLRLLEQQRNEQEVLSSGLKGELTRLPSASAQAKDLTARISNAEQECRSLQAALATAEAEKQSLETQRETLLTLQRSAAVQQQELEKHKQKLAAAQVRLSEAQDALTSTEANQAGHEIYQHALQAQQSLHQRLRQRRQLQEQQAAIDKQLTQAQTKKNAQEKLLAELATAETTAAALTAAVAKQESLEAELRAAQRQADQLQAAHVRVKQEHSAMAKATERLRVLKENVAQAQDIEASLGPVQVRIEALTQEMVAGQAKAAQLQAERETVKEQGQRLADMQTAICPTCEQPLSAAHRNQLIARLRATWGALNEKCQAAQETIEQAATERVQAHTTLSQQAQTLRSLPRQDAVESAETELADLRDRLTQAENLAASLEEAPNRVQQLSNSLTALDDPRRRRDVAQSQASKRPQVEEALQLLREEVTQQRAQRNAFDARLQAFATIDEEAAQLTATLEEFQGADDLYRRNQDTAAAFPKRQQDVSEAEHAWQSAQDICAATQAELAASTQAFDEERFQKTLAQEQELRRQSVQLETNLSHWREALDRSQEEIGQLQTKQKQLNTSQSLHKRLTEQYKLLQFLRTLLRDAGPLVTKALVQQISYTANQRFGEIMEEYTRTLHWQEDYGITLEVDGRQRAFAQLSGGEQMAAALAIRLAILQEMSDITIAFFDEPTTNLDDTRRSSLARQILEIRGFQQLFIISHDDSFEQATENLIRIQKRNGVSEVLQ